MFYLTPELSKQRALGATGSLLPVFKACTGEQVASGTPASQGKP
jgi:hypothetical protein